MLTALEGLRLLSPEKVPDGKGKESWQADVSEAAPPALNPGAPAARRLSPQLAAKPRDPAPPGFPGGGDRTCEGSRGRQGPGGRAGPPGLLSQSQHRHRAAASGCGQHAGWEGVCVGVPAGPCVPSDEPGCERVEPGCGYV